MDAIDRADIGDRIAAARRVDIVLNEGIGQYDRSDGGVLKGTGNANVDDEIGGIPIDAKLRCHGGVDFSDASRTGNEIIAETIKADASDRFFAYDSPFAEKRRNFFTHGIKKHYFHRIAKAPVLDEFSRGTSFASGGGMYHKSP